MNFAYLTVDVEEWYDLDYLKEYELESANVEVIPLMVDFLDLLDELDIKATFFVVANHIRRNADIIREIVARGHDIGCHGLDHQLLYDKSEDEYYEQIKEAKKLIEEVTHAKVSGYRASCYSMERPKLDLTQKAGYAYDGSKILFKEHPLYRNLDLEGFQQVDDLVYKQGDFFEYETPTLQMGKFDLPISGGGYLRLFPFWLIKYFIKEYEKTHHNFLIYVHPFELTNIKLPFPRELDLKTKFRAQVGRKNNLKKLEKIIVLLKNRGAEFRTLDYDRRARI